MGYGSRRSVFCTVGRKALVAVLLGTTAIVGSGMAIRSEALAQAQTSFNIPAGPLNQALAAFGRQSGTQLSYEASIASGKTSAGIQGVATREQALARILQGSGLTYSFKDARNVLITQPRGTAAGTLPSDAIPLDTIDVQGAGNPNSTMTPMPAYAGGQVATGGTVGMLGNRSLIDTPFNQTSYTSKLIQDQQARRIADVLMNDPSVRVVTGQGNATDGLYIRGFYYDSGDFALNGLYGVAPQYSSAANYVERVEVLKGPNALLNGMPPSGAISGSINIVTKHALDVDLTQLTALYVSNSQFGTNVDVSRRYGENKEWGLRFNGGYLNGNTAWDRQTNEFGNAVLGLDYRNDRVRWTADIGYQQSDLNPPMRYFTLGAAPTGVLALTSMPAAPKAGTNYEVPWAKWSPRDTFATTRAEVDLTETTTVYAAFGYHHSDINYLYPSPALINPGPYGPTGTWVTQAAQGRDIFDTLTGETGIRTAFDTGPISHLVTVSYSILDQDYGRNGLTSASITTGNIYTGSNAPLPSSFATANSNNTTTTQSSVGIADTISLWNKRLQFTIGARSQTAGADANVVLGTTSTHTDVSKSVWSPAYAVVVKPLENVSLYANYIEGLQGAQVVPTGYTNVGSVLPPAVTKQVEAGVKIDTGRLTSTFSAFEIRQPNTVAVGSVLTLDGEQRNRGVEWNLFGEITPTLRILGGIALLDGVQTRTASGINDGKRATDVPTVNLNLGAEWDTPFIPNLTLTGRVIHTSSEFANPTNTMVLPDWTRVDIGARYTFTSPWNGKPIVIRANVENLFNKSYWIGYSGVASLGAPRTYLVSTTFNF